jgi:hypothetical protein
MKVGDALPNNNKSSFQLAVNEGRLQCTCMYPTPFQMTHLFLWLAPLHIAPWTPLATECGIPVLLKSWKMTTHMLACARTSLASCRKGRQSPSWRVRLTSLSATKPSLEPSCNNAQRRLPSAKQPSSASSHSRGRAMLLLCSWMAIYVPACMQHDSL